MKEDYKPEGYNSLSPYLVVNGAQAVIDFAKNAFGAKELRRYDRPDGSIMHVELRIDDTILMLADAREDWPALVTCLHLYVPDVDASYERALTAGATSLQAPGQKDGDPDRRGGVKDTAGNMWWISTQLT